MKILHTADWHAGRTIRARSRADEHRSVLSEITDIAAENAVDLVLVAGDLFDVASPSPESESIVYRALISLAEVAPVVIVSGNHDNPRRFDALQPLLRLGRVRVGASVTRPEEGGVVEDVESLDVRIALVPFVSQRGIVRAAELMALDADEHGGQYAGRMRAIIEQLCSEMTVDTVNLVLGHVMVHGGVFAKTGGGERSAHTVFDYSVPSGAFPGHLSYAALGHLHRMQRIPAAAPVWYSGSPLQLDFGESGDDKGVIIVDVEPGEPANVQEVVLTAGRRLVTVRGTLEQVEAAGTTLGEAHVRVELDEPPRAGLADAVRELLPDVVDVVLVEERRMEIERSDTPRRLGREPIELFEEYLATTGTEDPRITELFSELLAEAHEA